MNEWMNETQLHEPMSDWRQPGEGGHDEEDELVHQRAAWEKKREERWRMKRDTQKGSLLSIQTF